MKFNLTCDKGNYRIDFTLDRKRKRFYPGTKDEATAKQLYKQMVYEWETGQFDLTLSRYRLQNRSQRSLAKANTENALAKLNTPKLLNLWDKWVESLHLPASTQNGHYHYIRQAIKRPNPQADDVAWFIALRESWSVSTWTSRRNYLKSCIQWAINEKEFTGKNPYLGLKPKKEQKEDKVKPFSPKEIKKILNALDTNQFCHPASAYKHSHYSSFARFLFITACRLGEATGLTWDCVDFQNRTIVIKQALGKDTAKSPGTTRKILKETKTGNVHYIPMNDALYQLLASIRPENAKGFVFKGQQGEYIDTATFRRRVWKLVLEKLGIEYRYPYQTRHTVLSAVASSQGLLAAAKLAGHKSLDMVSRHYARFTDEVDLPDFENNA